MLNITKAREDELNDIITHYKTVIEQIKDYDYTPGWIFGKYPKKEHLQKPIEKGNLYVGKIDSKIVSSIVIDQNENDGYDKLNWSNEFNADEIYYIHLVAVNQDYKNRRIAKTMLDYAFDMAKENSIKSIRLSLNLKNINIEPLYLKNGFEYVDSFEIFIEDRGMVNFNVYEKII